MVTAFPVNKTDSILTVPELYSADFTILPIFYGKGQKKNR